MEAYSNHSGMIKKLVHVANRNTGTTKTVFVVARLNHFTGKRDYFLRTLTQIKGKVYRNEMPLRLSEAGG